MTLGKVINRKTHPDEPYDVYIGRGSKWGNPYSHLPNTQALYEVETREDAIRLYEEWIRKQPELVEQAKRELKDKILSCYCWPLKCHGDILLKIAEEPKKELVVAFSGHRPNKIGGYTLPNPTYIFICQEIKKQLEILKPTKVISGMALGVDLYSFNVAHKLGIKVVSAVPFLGQEKVWPQKSQDIYHRLLKLASEVVIVNEGGYSAQKLQQRNEWMVNNCDILIAVWDGSEGGTANCIDYAKSKNKEIIYIDPRKA